MTTLKIFADTNQHDAIWSGDKPADIAKNLKEAGIRFEQWSTRDDILAGANQDAVIAAYQTEIRKLIDEEGYQTVDVISLNSDNPQKDELRQKFLSEHTHSEDEVRFFVQGQGLFALHIGDKVYEVLCEKGDLLSVPANTPHWFDLGPSPNLVAIRFFNNPDGWVAHYTGSSIADHYSRIEA